MKKVLIAVAVVALLAAGTSAYAHMWSGGYGGGMWGGGQGYMHGYGEGYGPGYGMHMRGGYQDEETQKFLEKTADTRREIHEKMFDLREAYRAGDEKRTEAIEKEVVELREKLADTEGSPAKSYGRGQGFCSGPYSN